MKRRTFIKALIGGATALYIPEFTRSVWALDRTHLEPKSSYFQTDFGDVGWEREALAIFKLDPQDRWIMIVTESVRDERLGFPVPIRDWSYPERPYLLEPDEAWVRHDDTLVFTDDR